MNRNYNIKAIKFFVLIWIIVGLGMILLPINSRFGYDLEVFFICTLFVVVVSITAVLWLRNTPQVVLGRKSINLLSRMKLYFIIKFSILSSILGLFLVIYDRVFVRGIDYSLGLRYARYQWLDGGVTGSIYGIIGNLLIPFSFCALFMSLYHWEKLNFKYKFLGIIVGFGGEFCLAMLNGGRSNVLLSIEFAFAVCVIRLYHGKSLIPRIRAKILLGIIVGVILIKYVESIFFAFSVNDTVYLNRLAYMLGTKVSDSYEGNSFFNIIIEMFIYLFHGVNYIGAQIEYGSGFADLSHNMTLRGIMTILSRALGVHYESELPSFDGGGGNFVALPGQLLYDYTIIFYIPICIIIGIFSGIMLKLLNKKNHNCSCVELLYVIVMMLVLYHSAIGMAIGFSYFFFMVFAILAMEIISIIKFGKGSNWTVLEDCLLGGVNKS